MLVSGFARPFQGRIRGYPGGGSGVIDSTEIAGAVTRVNNIPSSMLVYIFYRAGRYNKIVEVVRSDATGHWSVTGLNPNFTYGAFVVDPNRILNAAVLDNLTPVVPL